jgi:hypothetical protein
MRRASVILIGLFVVLFLPLAVVAQEDRLQGRWEGKVQAPQGEMPAVATFKKEGESYTGTITGMRGAMPFKQVKVEGNKVTAQSEVESPQGSLVVNYTFTLEGEALKGNGEVDFGGQTFAFNFDLKRVSPDPAAAGSGAAQTGAAGGQQRPGQGGGQRRDVPQPQQKQSLEYFAGQWNFKWIGRESALGPGGPREGTLTCTPTAGGKALDCRVDAKTEEGTFGATGNIMFDEQTKMLTVSEKLSNGVQINAKGDWTSPISIRFAVDPIKAKGQNLMLRRTISVIAAHSFSITDELSENGGPFVRLGNSLFTRAGSQ